MPGNRYLERNTSGVLHERAGIQSSAGAGDAGKIVALDSTGKIAANMIPAGANRFTSTDQIITVGGSLTLAHGLGSTPIRIWYDLVNVTAELGYTAGQRVSAQTVTGKNGAGPAMSIVPDSTNLNIRFNNNSPVFQICNFTTGAQVNITNASWTVRFFCEL